jgi:hypothetical protein
MAEGLPEASVMAYMPTRPAMSVSQAEGMSLLLIMDINVQGTTP